MNKDQIKGRIKESKGKSKEVLAKVTGNRTLEEKGRIQKTVGKGQTGFGDLKKDVKKRD